MAEIAEDQPLIEPGTAWNRQLWAIMIPHQEYIGLRIYPAELQNNYYCWGTLNMPTDFTTLNRLNLVLYRTATANNTVRVDLFFGRDGELYNTHTGWLNIIVAMVANRFISIDLVTYFPALLALLTAGDHLLVRAQNLTAGTIHIYGLDARYS